MNGTMIIRDAPTEILDQILQWRPDIRLSTAITILVREIGGTRSEALRMIEKQIRSEYVGYDRESKTIWSNIDIHRAVITDLVRADQGIRKDDLILGYLEECRPMAIKSAVARDSAWRLISKMIDERVLYAIGRHPDIRIHLRERR